MSNTLSKRVIQIALLCIILVSGLSSADPSSRIEPVGAPVPVENSADEENRPDPVASPTNYNGVENVIEQSIAKRFESGLGEHGGGSFHWALLIPIFAISFVFGGPIVLIIVLATLHYRSKARRAQIDAELTLKALEAGRELPPELLGQKLAAKREDNLRRGVKNVGLGIGIVAGLSLLVGFDIGALGFILVGIGGAQLVLWKLEYSKQNDVA